MITGHHFDYTNQAWTLDGRYVACGHPSCRDTASDIHQKYNLCYGTVHEGELAPAENLSFWRDEPYQAEATAD